MPRRVSSLLQAIPAALLLPALAMAQAQGSAACPHFQLSAVPGRIDSPLLSETSGLVTGRRSPGVLWVHNDSGDSARFFAINQQGELLVEFDLQGPDIEAKDWEDIAIGRGRSGDASYLYLGDIGDNARKRATIDVYRVLEPSVDTTARRRKVAIDRGQVERITMQYPRSEPHNAETLLLDPVDGALYVVTKDLDSARVFRAPAEMLKDHAHLTLSQVAAVNPRRFDFRITGLTGGDISADGAWIILRNRSEGFLWPRKPGTSLGATLGAHPDAPCLISVGDGETLGLLPDGSAYFTVQEGAGRPVFRFDRETPAPARRAANAQAELDERKQKKPPAAEGRGPATARRPDIDLVVLIAIDQMRPDYFDRFASQLTGGLDRIRRRAVFYPNALQDHAFTETAPGHAAMLSGREPVHTGIATNDRGVQDASAPLIGARGKSEGASPARFRGTALYDWMVAADSKSRVLSVSRKDRGAIFPVGRARGAVYWYADGRFTTSRYYADTLPTWVRGWNDSFRPETFGGRPWMTLLPDSAYSEIDDQPFENKGQDRIFPHALPPAGPRLAEAITGAPVMDSLTLDVALRGIGAMRLGQTGHTDLLSISLSTTDAIGHAYGPDSREIHDQILRVDRYLGHFLDSLRAMVPGNRTLLVLTADHGMSSFPEFAFPRDGSSHRIDLAPMVNRIDSLIETRSKRAPEMATANGLVEADLGVLHAAGIDADSLARVLADSVARLAGVARTYTHATLAAAPPTDTLALRFRRALPDDFGWIMVAVAKPGYIFASKAAGTHGTMNADDLTVPIAVVAPGVPARRVARPVRSVDIAPTLAAWLRLTPTDSLDGKRLAEVGVP